MRTVPVVAAAVWLVGGLGASPFAGLDQAPGVYVTVDGYGITIRQSAVDWDFHLPDGSMAEWKRKKGHGFGLPPHIEITCRVAGGYLPAASAKAIWTVPRPAGMPKRLGRKQRKRWKRLWPWTYDGYSGLAFDNDALDLGLSAMVEGTGASLSLGTGNTRFKVTMQFEVDLGTAVAARMLARYCTVPGER